MESAETHACRHGTLIDFQGSLADVLLFDLYRQIYLSRQTGTLEIYNGDALRRVSFRKGSVTFATTNRDSERLGSLLVAEGKITPEQLETVLIETRSGKRSGRVLVQRGLVGAEEMDLYLRKHQSELAISVLNWKRGTFRFSKTLPAEYEDVFIDLSTADIILEGVRRIPNPAEVLELLGDSNRLLRLALDPLSRFQNASLSAQEGYLLSRLEQPTTISEICRVSALGESATRRALLGFVLAGILDYAESPEAERGVWAETAPPRAAESTPDRDDTVRSTPDVGTMKKMLAARTLYEVLGVPRRASVEQIRRAYLIRARAFHPDKWSKATPIEVIELAERVFQTVETAYKVLATPLQRERYDRQLAASRDERPGHARDLGKASHAHIQDVARCAFEEGLKLDRGRMYAAAMNCFREAVRSEDSNALYRFHLARTLAKLPGRSREADFHFRIAIHQSPWNADFQKAYQKFKQDPAHHDKVESLFEAAVADLDPQSQS